MVHFHELVHGPYSPLTSANPKSVKSPAAKCFGTLAAKNAKAAAAASGVFLLGGFLSLHCIPVPKRWQPRMRPDDLPSCKADGGKMTKTLRAEWRHIFCCMVIWMCSKLFFFSLRTLQDAKSMVQASTTNWLVTHSFVFPSWTPGYNRLPCISL